MLLNTRNTNKINLKKDAVNDLRAEIDRLYGVQATYNARLTALYKERSNT
jgi:hypothetical protein